jgi:ketosteroid isomerase-like protein
MFSARSNNVTTEDSANCYILILSFTGRHRFLTAEAKARTWSETWEPFQPGETERRMNPRVVAASEDQGVVLWRQRGVSPSGERFEGEVLGLYQIREGKLARAQMFCFDTVAVASFLKKATSG